MYSLLHYGTQHGGFATPPPCVLLPMNTATTTMNTDPTTPATPATVVQAATTLAQAVNAERVWRMGQDLVQLASLLPTLAGSGVPVGVGLSAWGEANVHLTFPDFMDAHQAGLLVDVVTNEVWHNPNVPTLHYTAFTKACLPSGTRVSVVACQQGKPEPVPAAPPVAAPAALVAAAVAAKARKGSKTSK